MPIDKKLENKYNEYKNKYNELYNQYHKETNEQLREEYYQLILKLNEQYADIIREMNTLNTLSNQVYQRVVKIVDKPKQKSINWLAILLLGVTVGSIIYFTQGD